MWTISDVKARGKEAFKTNYWKSVLVAFILSLFTGAASSSVSSNAQDLTVDSGLVSPAFFVGLFVGLAVIGVIALLIKIFLLNPLEIGCYRFFKKNVEQAEEVSLDVLKEGFQDYGRVFVTLFLRDLFLVLWSCLFVIPGIVKSYSYRMVPFIIRDNPELTGTEAITRSRELMNGHKWRTFLFDLSFIGWYILGAITFGLVNIFWTQPYEQNANAALYLELTKNENGAA